ncbi:DMT family transporter [Phenylobacterium sp. J367]|nr:DMT family transporter [Phenylobacterium sp. J367]
MGVVPPMALVFWRWVAAFAIVSAVAWRHVRKDRAELIRRWPTVLALAATGVASFGALLYVGLQRTTALNTLVVQAAIPPLIMLFAWLFLRERTTRWQVGGVAVSLLGVLVVLSRGRPWDLLHLGLNAGDAVVLFGVVLYAVYSLILRRRPQVHPMSLLWATFGAAILLLAPFYAAELIAGRHMTLNAPTLLGVAYVAIFPSFLAYLFFNRGVELIGAARASQYLHLQPVFGAVLAVLLLGEAFHLFHAAGLALIGAGILLSSWRPKGLERNPLRYNRISLKAL